MAGCESLKDFVRVLEEPARNRKLIRATLGNLAVEDWALPAVDEALRAADGTLRAALRDAARPSLSKKRVSRVCGPSLGAHWDEFFDEGSRRPARLPSTGAKLRKPERVPKPTPASPTRRVSRAVPVNGLAAPGVPLRDAGAMLQAAMAKHAEEKESAAAEGRQTREQYLQSTVRCRECLRTYKRVQLPNPRRHVCEDCGGRAESTSIRAVSGGSPGLGRRR